MNKRLNEIIGLYHLYPLGLTNALHDQTNMNRFDVLDQWLDHIHAMGFDTIQIGPMAQSLSHGYDTVDYYQVDGRLGSNTDFRKWVDKAHGYGIKVILDTVFNHVSREFFAFNDLLHHTYDSKYVSWFKHVDFANTNSHHDPFSYQGWRGIEDLVELNLSDLNVKHYLFEVAKYWIETYDIDGMRLDSADVMDFQFLKELKAWCNQCKDGFIMLGEVIHGDYGHIIQSSELDTLTNYALHKAIYSSLNSRNYFELAHNQDRLYGPYGLCRNIPLVTFADNHDVTRIIDQLNDPRDLFNVYTYIFTAYGIPSVYYGSEFGIHGKKMPGSDDSLRPALDLNEWLNLDISIYDHILKLLDIRKKHMDAFSGTSMTVVLTNTVFGYIRQGNHQRVLTIMSCADQQEVIQIHLDNAQSIDFLMNEMNYEWANNTLTVTIPPHASTIIKII